MLTNAIEDTSRDSNIHRCRVIEEDVGSRGVAIEPEQACHGGWADAIMSEEVNWEWR
jgi:hypothetical protein